MERNSKTIPHWSMKCIDDPKTIFDCLIKRNSIYLNQSWGISYTINVLSSLLQDNSFTKFGEEIL